MKSEDILIYLGYFAVAAIALHFILAVLKVQSDYIYNTSIGFPNDKLQGSVVEGFTEGFKEGFVNELNEKEKENLTKAGEETDVILTKFEKDMADPLKKRIKSCPQDTLDAIKELIEFIDNNTVVTFLNDAITSGNGNPKGMWSTVATWLQGKGKHAKILQNPEQRKILFKYLEGKGDTGGGGGVGGW